MKDMFMQNREALRIALESLRLHKTRSFLTMLGIVFGVGAVIAMLSIGEGARQESLEQIEVLGVRNIIIRSQDPPDENADEEALQSRPLGISLKDADAIRDVCDFVDNIAVNWEATAEARTYDGKARVSLIGYTPEHAKIFNVRLSSGGFLHKHHLKQTANVCVIGSEARQALFGFQDPLFRMVKLQDQWFTVIGVMQEKSLGTGSGIGLPESNSSVIIPITTAMAKFPR
ncbi:MAG: ABC transporter permease, partial [Bacteroidetes bacterium]|nr:ABC transporter permease [Bacteroidota bacterium]